MTRFLLDSDVLIRVIRRHPGSLARLKSLPQESWSISAMTAYELQKGISKNPNSTSNLIARELLGASRIEAIDERVANRAAKIHADLKSSGITIGTADEFIAAQALEVDATLVTNNTKHFARVPGLKLESWL